MQLWNIPSNAIYCSDLQAICRKAMLSPVAGKALGMNIRELREAAGMTQVQLATAAGVKQADISKWETGKANPNAQSLIRLAVGLKCTIDKIVAGVDREYETFRRRDLTSGAPVAQPVDQSAAIAADLSRQVEAFLQVPDRMRRRFLRFPPAVPPRPESPRETSPADAPVAAATHEKRGRVSPGGGEKRR